MSNIVSYVLQLKNQISGPLAQAQAAVANFQAKLSGVQQQAEKTSDGFGKLGLAAAGAFIAYKAIELGKQIVGMGVNMEQTRVQFETFTGSAEKGNAVIAQLQKFSLATPFDDEQVLKAGKSLLAFGENSADLESTLTKIGNISSATGKDFNELTTIYGKARTAGTLYAEDINQLVEAGIPIIDEFAKQMGVPASQVKKLASEGKISFGMLQKGFENLGGASGKWGSLMDKQSKTVAGRWSSLVGFAQNLGSQLGEAALPFMGAIVDKGSEVLQWVQTNKAKFAELFAPLMKAMQPIIDSFKRVTESMGYTGTVSDMLEKTFNRIGYAIQVVSPFIEMAATLFGKVYEAVASVINIFVKYFQTNKEAQANVLGLYNAFKTAFSLIGDIAGRVLGGIVKAIDGILNRDFSKLGSGLKDIVSAPFGAVTNKDNYHFNDKAPVVKDFFGDKAASATDAARNAAAGAKGALGTSAAKGKDTSIKTKVGDVSGSKPTTINITIHKMTGVEQLHTTNLKESTADIQKLLTEMLLAGITDFSLVAGKN